MRTSFLAATLVALTLSGVLAEEADTGPATPVPYSGKTSNLELPDISAIVDAQLNFTDPDSDRNGKLQLKHAEVAVQGYLYPSIRGDFIVAFEQSYIDDEVETDVHVEEAYASFLELPWGFQALAGRKFIGFGRLNPVHSHHWAFAETPAPLANLFGDHSWFDDGGELSCLIPNPGDLYIKLSAGAWNGRSLEHNHGEEEAHAEEEHEEDTHGEDDHEEEHAEHEALIEWDGAVFTGRAFMDLPVTEAGTIQLGYSIAGDEGSRNLLQNLDLVVRHQAPNSRQKIKWHTELFYTRDKERDTSPFGLFSYLTYAPDNTWEFGGEYDFTELLADDTQDLWAGSAFVTRYLTHTTYLRAGYRYTDYSEEERESEQLAYLQLVWGLGPHAHRLED